MSTLEKTVNLLKSMPNNKIDTVYAFVRFINSDIYTTAQEEETINQDSPSDASVETRHDGFQRLMSFAGTLPDDFDYKQELEEARKEKYARFI